ncbi:MAG TPA: response regulator [Terriglobales bacterium]|jgi:CheY-like chemotaxis protein|nr:response regulator [Terriglobales bacterium]
MSNPPTPKTILCIDDNDGVLEYQKALLERRGYAVLTASSARQGLQIAADNGVAAVIVDYHMPEINGHEVALEIKRLKPNTPIVMVSSEEQIPSHVLDVVDAFVPKDQAPTRLVPVLARICDDVLAKVAERTRLSA